MGLTGLSVGFPGFLGEAKGDLLAKGSLKLEGCETPIELSDAEFPANSRRRFFLASSQFALTYRIVLVRKLTSC